MGSVGAPEVLVILVLALLVLGPDRLPQAARTVGRWMGEIRRLTGSLQTEVRDVVDEVMRPVNETATLATESFTSTVSATGGGGHVDLVDPNATAALPSEASSEPHAASSEVEVPRAADVPLPGAEEGPAMETAPALPARPIDPSLN